MLTTSRTTKLRSILSVRESAVYLIKIESDRVKYDFLAGLYSTSANANNDAVILAILFPSFNYNTLINKLLYKSSNVN